MERVAQRSRRQREQLLEVLQPAVGLDRGCATIESARAVSCCPGCRGRRLHRHGLDRGVQRYRFLHLAKKDRPGQLAGIAEADELFLLESQKGSRKLDRPPRKHGGRSSRRGINGEHVCVLVARDRTGATRDAVTGRGAVTAAQLHKHLLPVLDRDVLLVTDGHTAYRAFARSTGISHASVNLRAGERVRGAVHVQNVNAYHQRFRQWLSHFNGVASRYLLNYLGWLWAVDGQRIGSAEQMLHIALGSASNNER
ncbi:IS1595 family transposase [Massilia sp. UMI-21]|nr:IS1595 family transposase [Massilia sp. UMI-21]